VAKSTTSKSFPNGVATIDTSDLTFMPWASSTVTPLSYATWKDVSYESVGQEIWYSFNATSSYYYVYWNDYDGTYSSYGGTAKTGDITVTAYNGNNGNVVSGWSGGIGDGHLGIYLSGITGNIYLKVYVSSSGSYGIIYH
jgi:hypothetical protein